MESWFLEPFHFLCAILLLTNSCTVEEIWYFGIYISWFAFQLVWWMSLSLMCFFSWYLSCKYWFLLLFYYFNKIQIVILFFFNESNHYLRLHWKCLICQVQGKKVNKENRLQEKKEMWQEMWACMTTISLIFSTSLS